MASDAEFLQCLYESAALEFWIIIINRYCGDLTVSTIKMFREIINELLVVWSRELKNARWGQKKDFLTRAEF